MQYTPPTGGGGISQTDADARYAPLASQIVTTTVSSGEIASGGTANVDFSGLPARVVVLGLRLDITAGACDAAQVKLYRGNPPGGTDLGNVIGPTGNIDPNFAHLALGPQRYTNAYGFAGPVVTSSGHLVAKVYNNAAGAATFDVTLSYMALP